MGIHDDWEHVLYSIHKQGCTPFIGAGAGLPWIPPGKEIAYKFSQEYQYPLYNDRDLSAVSEFMMVNSGDPMYPKMKLSRQLYSPSKKGFSFGFLTDLIEHSISKGIVTILDASYAGAVRIGK
jgi:hypothetical protein